MNGVARLGVGISLVGRRAELAALTAALDRATHGTPSGVVLSGDAGVGKSRMVAETVERAGAAGFTVLVGRCLDTAESALPYLPFTEVVGLLAATQPELVGRHTALAHLLPGGFPRGEAVGERRGEHELGQLRVFDAVLSVLDELTADAPVLLVIEDLHWADRSSRDLLTFLLSRLTGQRLVVLATYRSDDLHRRHPLRPVLAELVRLPAVERIELAPLCQVESLELVRLLADGGLPDPALRRAARRSEGNAFFAEELVSASSDGLPHGLAEVLIARIEGLSPETQRMLRTASVAGRVVRHDRLASVSGMDVDTLEKALREAVAHHVLVTESSGLEDTYSFRHALQREAIYGELLPGERSRIHGAYAELLASPALADEPGRAAALARHAMAAHDLPRALAARVQAARDADDREAPAEMLMHAERAIELWSAVPDAEGVAGVDEITLTRWAAWGASATGDPERGIALGKRALELAEANGVAERTSAVARRYALRLTEMIGREQEAITVAQQALELIADHEPAAAHAWCHAILARVMLRLDRFAESIAEAEATLAIAGTLPADDLEGVEATADALVTLAVCEEYGGNPAGARRRLAEAKPLARRSGNLPSELRAYYSVGISLLDEGRLAEAADEFATGMALAAENGVTWSTFGLNVRVALVMSRFMTGEWARAREAAEIAGTVSVTVASRLTAAGLLPAVAEGSFATVERTLAELHAGGIADDQAIMLTGQTTAEAALWQGRPAEAESAVRATLHDMNSGPLAGLAPHLGGIMIAALGVAAHAELAESGAVPRERAVAAAAELLAQAEDAARNGVPRTGALGPEGRAWLERARAELSRVRGEPDPAAWGRVVTEFAYESGGAPTGGYRQAYAQLRLAESLLASGSPHGSVEEGLRQALATAQRLGARPLAAAVEELAVRAGARIGNSRQAAGPASDLLTPRERSVLGLVAQGQTNRQAGATLFISEKTVSVHLSRVMAKLGASSRTEAVSIAYARGLLAPALARSDP